MKKTNKGFSLVELIIVIAIMAILAAALAPALIRYIDKSRRSSDLSNAGILQSAAQSAAADETAYTEISGAMDKTKDVNILQAAADGKTAWKIEATNGVQNGGKTFLDEFTSTAGKNAPALKLRKGAPSTPVWHVAVTPEGGFKVLINKTELVPSAHDIWAK